jgi:signal transduction histidine kinase
MARKIFLTGTIFLGIALIFVYFLSEKIARPIREITQVAIALCQGNLDVKAKVTTEDEVGILGKSLNTMSAHLQKTFQELTNQKKAAETAQQKAENANRAKSTFLAKMSHELRTPLNAILGYSEFLEEELTDRGEEDLNEDLQKIQTAGKNLLDMVNNILDICKLETGEIDLNLETFSIVPLIEEIVATSKLLVSQNNNQLKVEYSPDIGSMYGDFTKVRQCLLNLLSNAAKFTKEGIIRFQIKRENVGDQDWIYFQIKDTGIGIAPEQQGQLFSAFKQVDSSATRKFDGAGLGLAIAKQYCQIMEGNITLESELGKGSTFCLKLPAQIKNPERQEL